MPCRDDWGDENRKIDELHERLDETTRLLCETIRKIKSLGYRGVLSAETQKWFKAHEDTDRKRLRQEALSVWQASVNDAEEMITVAERSGNETLLKAAKEHLAEVFRKKPK